ALSSCSPLDNSIKKRRWRVPVVPATREAEPAGSLEPRSSGLQCALPSRHQYGECRGAGGHPVG
uniref:Uncharacterized protein n=1 Tax=Accipiter nisus TaxID=211598 RepID=A0A8B9MRV4_9AVES